jgi:hypothetical protein
MIGLVGMIIGALLSIGAWAISPHVGPIALAMIGILVGMFIGGVAVGRLTTWLMNKVMEGGDESKHWALLASVYQELIPMARKYDRDTLLKYMDEQLADCYDKMRPMFDPEPPCPHCEERDTTHTL